MTIDAPNTHPVWDPTWATHKLLEAYGPQVELGRELVRYGADLLLRAIQSAPDDLPNHVVLSVLFRDAVAALDGCMLALEGAAVAAARVHLRGQMEARWGLTLGLQDPSKWGRHLHVSARREERVWVARLVPGSPEYEAYGEARALIEAGGGKGTRPEYGEYLKHIDETLAKPENAATNHMFAEYERKNKGRKAPWYYDSGAATPIKTIAGLARAVGGKAEYDTIYRHSSHYVHGAFAGTSLKREDKAVIIAPIRTPDGWREVFLFSASLAADSFRRVIDKYRHGELDVFVRKYKERWRTVIQSTPEVEVVLDRIVNA